MKESKNLFKRFGFIAIGLCVACCAFPVIGVLLGIGALSLLSKYIEWAGMGALILAVVSFAIYYYKKMKAPACDIDCECKTEGIASKDTSMN
jgi:hypothetical protein